MEVHFVKYQALGNDFLVIESGTTRLARARRAAFAQAICQRHTGIGADGVLFVTRGHRTPWQVEIVNADGSPAEKSGNGLRSVALHAALSDPRRRHFTLEMGGGVHCTRILKRRGGNALVCTELGSPSFEAARVPVRCRRKYLINSPLSLGGTAIPVTCLSIGNPHTVLLVDSFDVDWQSLGAAIERDRHFPNQTNVEFVKVVSRCRLEVADWERGAGATGSSGTGAAAAVCACVMMGLADRKCEVRFSTGSLLVNWDDSSNLVELTGPVSLVARGEYWFPC